jgi:hypothetical protein
LRFLFAFFGEFERNREWVLKKSLRLAGEI